MTFSRNYMHVYIFAAFYIGFATMVAWNSEETIGLTGRLMANAEGAYGDLQAAYEWALAFDMAAVIEESDDVARMMIDAPAAPYEAVSESLKTVVDRHDG